MSCESRRARRGEPAVTEPPVRRTLESRVAKVYTPSQKAAILEPVALGLDLDDLGAVASPEGSRGAALEPSIVWRGFVYAAG